MNIVQVSLNHLPSFSVIGQTAAPKSCFFRRRLYRDRITWEHECNSCRCSNGQVSCTKVSGQGCCYVMLPLEYGSAYTYTFFFII